MPSPKRLRLLLVVLECGWQVPSSDIESIEKEEDWLHTLIESDAQSKNKGHRLIS